VDVEELEERREEWDHRRLAASGGVVYAKGEAEADEDMVSGGGDCVVSNEEVVEDWLRGQALSGTEGEHARSRSSVSESPNQTLK